MKIWAISDPHFSFGTNKPMDIFGERWANHVENFVTNWNKSIKKNDIVLVSGDISWAMKLEEAKVDLNELHKLKGTKIIIKGNHEYWWKSISSVRSILPDSIKALQNDSLKIGKFIFCGTRGWTVPEPNKQYSDEDMKIYKRECERLKLTLKHMSTSREEGDEVIAMIHFPPFNSKLEDSEFTKLFEEYGVNKVVYGHIHDAEGRAVLKARKNGIDYFLTSCDQINMQPILIAKS